MSPGAHAFDINNLCIGGECVASTTDTAQNSQDDDSSSSDTTMQHNCGHWCHYGHAINTFYGHPITLTVSQNFSESYNSPVSHCPDGIKRPPRVTA
ncbi:MAG: hypothetical protein WC748_08300 [Legionellales bacterium]